jgi:hypothetical protein
MLQKNKNILMEYVLLIKYVDVSFSNFLALLQLLDYVGGSYSIQFVTES